MSRILKVNGDYKLQVQTGGNIILDTQSSSGNVTIIGNLDVKGVTTYVENTNTEIKDNILQLNFGQTGNGISGANSYVSGIEVERGNYPAAQLLFSEQITHYDSTTNTNLSGTWTLKNASGALGGLQVRSLGNDGLADLVFDLHGQNPVLRIANTNNYYLRVLNANDIPNVQWVQNYVSSNWNPSNPSTQGSAVVPIIQYPTNVAVTSAQSSIQATATNLVFQIAQTTIATISSTGASFGNVAVGGSSGSAQNTIGNTSSNNLIITANNGNVEVAAVLNLDNVATPTYTSGTSKIFSSATAGPGRSGVYFANSTSFGLSTGHEADELISRNRAVLLSILL
jgi:hypothetical protein